MMYHSISTNSSPRRTRSVRESRLLPETPHTNGGNQRKISDSSISPRMERMAETHYSSNGKTYAAKPFDSTRFDDVSRNNETRTVDELENKAMAQNNKFYLSPESAYLQTPQASATQRRSQFQKSYTQRQSMGQSDSRAGPDAFTAFSSSFDSSCSLASSAPSSLRSRIQRRADSTTSDDGPGSPRAAPAPRTRENKHQVNRSGGNRVASSNAKQTRISNNTGSTQSLPAPVKKPMTIPASSQAIIRYCMDNAKDDLAARIVLRMYHKREDFANFASGLSSEQWQSIVGELKEFLRQVVIHIDDGHKVPKRSWGFRADYFAVMANAVTTECVFLDGAAHPATEAIEAWATLVEIMFSSVRDGYYQQIRYLRKNSYTLNGLFSGSIDGSDPALATPTPPIRSYDYSSSQKPPLPTVPVVASGTVIRF